MGARKPEAIAGEHAAFLARHAELRYHFAWTGGRTG
jgi:hypothetical protein